MGSKCSQASAALHHNRFMIVQELYKIQHRHGYLPRRELEALADHLALPLYRIQEVASFFPHYRTSPPRKLEIQVCRDMSCQLRGADAIQHALSELAATQPSADVQVSYVSCLGRCDRAPAVRFCQVAVPTSSGHGHTTRTTLSRSYEDLRTLAQTMLEKGTIDHIPHDSDASNAATDPDRWQMNPYVGLSAEERYASVRQFIANGETVEQRQAAADRIIKALETAGLLGMGGAGGRTYKKWSEVREAQGARKYVVCNGDESEPATFKDRELLLRTPHLVLEGVLLAGLLLGATRGYIYIRHEYEEQIEAMEKELEVARQLGVCGNNVLGSGIAFPVEVFVSPGGYICGEQTALVQAMEDKRAEPRNRPPELQTNGLWDMPTLLNNVETLAWVPAIVLREDGQWYARQGADSQFKGARFFSISGDVARPGVYEVPIGITLGTLIDEHAGGMRDGQNLKAVALSGPSGGFLPATLPLAAFPPAMKEKVSAAATEVNVRDLELDVALFRKWNLMLGGGIVVYGEHADMVAQARVCSEFYRQESCGKCVPCRIGSTKLAEIATSLQTQQLDDAAIQGLRDKSGQVMELATVMRQTAICGLGTVAANPITTLLTHFDREIKRSE